MSFRFYLGVVGLLLFGFSLQLISGIGGCGGSSTSTDGTAAVETVTITGTVTGASGSSSSLSALSFKNALAEAPVANETCTLYNEHGTEIGTVMTDEDGVYTVNVEESLLNPDGAESVTVNLILECASGYSSFAEVTIDASTSSVMVSADPESTLAAAALKNKMADLGCTGWSGCDFDAVGVDFDAFCFCQLEGEKWKRASASGGGVTGGLGAMRDMMLSQLAAGDYGAYGNPGDMMQAFLNGDVDNSLEERAASRAAALTGTPAETYTANAQTGLGGIRTLLNTMTDSFAGGSAGAGVTALRVKRVVEATSDSLCGTVLADPDALSGVVDVLLAAEDFDEVGRHDEGSVGQLNALLRDIPDRSGLNWRAVNGLLDACIDDGDPMKCELATMRDFLDNPPTGGGDDFDFRDWARAGMGCCIGVTTCDPTKCGGWAATQIAGGADLGNICSDPRACATIFEKNVATIDYATCLADPSSCQDQVRPGCQTAADCPSGVGCDPDNHACLGTFSMAGYCGDGICQNDRETATRCPADCGQGVKPPPLPPPLLPPPPAGNPSICAQNGSDDFSNANTLLAPPDGCWLAGPLVCGTLSVASGKLSFDASTIACSNPNNLENKPLMMSKQISAASATITLRISSWAKLNDIGDPPSDPLVDAGPDGISLGVDNASTLDPNSNIQLAPFALPPPAAPGTIIRHCKSGSNTTNQASECNVAATSAPGVEFCLRVVKAANGDVDFKHSADCTTYTTLRTVPGLITEANYVIKIIFRTKDADGDLGFSIEGLKVE